MNRKPTEIDLNEIQPDNAEHNGIQHYARSGGSTDATAVCKGYVKRINRNLVVFSTLYIGFHVKDEYGEFLHEYLEDNAELWLEGEESEQFTSLEIKKEDAVSFTAKAFGFRARFKYDYALKNPSNVERLDELEFDEEGIIQRQKAFFLERMAKENADENKQEEFKEMLGSKMEQIEALQDMSTMEQAAYILKLQQLAQENGDMPKEEANESSAEPEA